MIIRININLYFADAEERIRCKHSTRRLMSLTSQAWLSFVLHVPVHNLTSSMVDFAPCDIFVAKGLFLAWNDSNWHEEYNYCAAITNNYWPIKMHVSNGSDNNWPITLHVRFDTFYKKRNTLLTSSSSSVLLSSLLCSPHGWSFASSSWFNFW